MIKRTELSSKKLFYFYTIILSLAEFFQFKEKTVFSLIIVIGTNYFLFLFLFFDRIRRNIFAFLCLVLFCTKLYEYHAKIKVSTDVIRAIYFTSAEEFTAFISWYWYVPITIFTVFLATNLFVKATKSKIFDFRIFLFFCIFGLTSRQLFRDNINFAVKQISRSQPVDFVEEMFYVHDREGQVKLSNLERKFNIDNVKLQNTNVVLIIGESARADRFEINGYSKNTNPLLKKQKNLVSFKNAYSCGNSTNFSVPCLLNYETEKTFKFPLKSQEIVSVFKDMKFNTSFYSTQHIQRNPAIFHSCNTSDRCEVNVRGYDVVLNGFAKNEIEKTGNNFVILHQTGSHFEYIDRTPAEFLKFKPLCEGSPFKCKIDSLNNSYDNTIFYTDFVLNDLIEGVKNTNTIIFYTSDHGEALMEKGIYGHGNVNSLATKEQKNVPFMIWMSDKFIQQNKINISKLRSKKDAFISHDNLFFSILGSIGVVDKNNLKLNLFNNERSF